MNKKTTTDIDSELSRSLDDANSNNYSANLRLDKINDAIEYLQQILIGAHKDGFVAVQWPFKKLPFETFSYANQITLPDDYDTWIECRYFGDDSLIEIVPFSKIYDTTTKAYACIYASSISAPVADTTNTGTDDFEVFGDFTGSEDLDYSVELDGATTFRWSDDGGSTWDVETVTITGDWQTLNNGVEIKFGSTSGLTSGDTWTFSAYVSKVVHIMKLNVNPSSDILFTYARRQTEVSAIGATTYLPFPRFYRALKLITELLLREWNEEDIDVQAQLNDIAIKRVRDVIRQMNAGERTNVAPRKSYGDYV